MKKALATLTILALLSVMMIGCTSTEINPPLLSVAGDTNVDLIPTDITCSSIQDCIDYALEQDPTATNIQATCEDTCTFITEKTPNVEVTIQ